MTTGLLMIHTGDGKGKTTAALGMAMRAMGHGQRVCVVQFIKGSWTYGELSARDRFGDLLEFHVMGRGFTWKSDNMEKDAALAREAWTLATEKIASGDYAMVVLDELTYLIAYDMLAESEVLRALADRPAGVHVVITGRDASPGLLAAADMVTEMKAVRHHYRAGVKAQRGVEF
jgi:cob(I)alamin adenosyltransferase